MKIQSVSDIITNSSSEVFVRYDEYNINEFKKSIEIIFNALNEDKNISIDDVIEIEPIFEMDDYIIEFWQKDNNTKDMPTREDLIKYAYEMTTEAFEEGEKGYPMITGLKITPKDPKYENIASAIEKLIEIFPSESLYC
ncbi:MAG: hypothetical protein [Wendovervirus sonii]|uniref:Uncharacterized protein n=1 Tax=phage Lak_Megaphage_Sonny TaxID=3109229 RepID=A0ABZ0Z6K9_9CAUD|nr:MAG: hypothetical protein [phage Lak_Megaphage_Sonny]